MRLPKVLRPVSRLIFALQGLKAQLRDVTEALDNLRLTYVERGPAIARLEALELSRHQFEAQCEGLLQKAEGKFRAATNAEARERANKRSYEHLLSDLDEVGDPEAPAGRPRSADDVAPGETEGVPPLHLDVAPSVKTLAQRAKFGVK